MHSNIPVDNACKRIFVDKERPKPHTASSRITPELVKQRGNARRSQRSRRHFQSAASEIMSLASLAWRCVFRWIFFKTRFQTLVKKERINVLANSFCYFRFSCLFKYFGLYTTSFGEVSLKHHLSGEHVGCSTHVPHRRTLRGTIKRQSMRTSSFMCC